MTLSLEEATPVLSQIIGEAARNHEEIILTRNNIAIAKLVPLDIKSPVKPRQPGSAKGLVTIADDFDAPLDDFEEYQ